MNILEKLQAIQSTLNVPKKRNNKFGNYNYRNCEDIQEAAKPLLKQVKAALTVGDDLVLIGDRYYIKATAILWDLESDQTITNTAYAREETEKKGMDAAQITGSASSYARKYALNGLFCIDDVRDPDEQEPFGGQNIQGGSGGSGNQRGGSSSAAGNQQGQNYSRPQNQGQNQSQQTGRGTGRSATGNASGRERAANSRQPSSGPTSAPVMSYNQTSAAGKLDRAALGWIEQVIWHFEPYGLKKQKVFARYGITDLSRMTPDNLRDFRQLIKAYEKKEAAYEQSSFVG